MCFNPVADAWWEKKPRIVDFAAYKPRKGGGAGAYAFCGARPALEQVEDRWEKVPRSFHIIYALSVK